MVTKHMHSIYIHNSLLINVSVSLIVSEVLLHMTISSVTVDESPQLLLMKSVKIPQRSLVVLNTSCSATKEHVGEMYRVRTNHGIQNDYPNLIMLSAICRIDELVKTGVPLIAINMGIYDIWLTNNP